MVQQHLYDIQAPCELLVEAHVEDAAEGRKSFKSAAVVESREPEW
jgi:hypothetical protein